MIVTNYRDKYIKVQSDSLFNNLLDDLAAFESIQITAKQGCNGTPITTTINTDDIDKHTYVIDLGEAVLLENKVYKLIVDNIYSLEQWNVITNPIDLGYVNDNCDSTLTIGCTLQAYQSHFAPLFKTQIDAWFLSKSITSNVIVTFTGNVMKITGIPTNFGFVVVLHDFEDVAPYKELPFSFATLNSYVLLANDFLYIAPQFFDDTLITDDVYEITLKYNRVDNGGFVTETTCSFIDSKIRCKVAAYIGSLINTGLTKEAEQLMLLHYALRNGSNCDCNCADLCKIYDAILAIITSNPIEDCGCN